MNLRTTIASLIVLCAISLFLIGCAATDDPDLAVEEEDAPQDAMGDSTPVQIVKSANDPRSYRYLTLDNELTAILVHRPEEGKAGAALAVARGSNHDLPEYAGIAHFLEHMLFLGTEKYPDPDGYSDFISKYGGSNNAFTANEMTNYFFDIDEQQFPEALDRFAQFFTAPLLDDTYVEREKNAVHSEYQMQMRNDGWRGFSVLKTIMNPDHPMSRFSIGSSETLANVDRDLVLAYYKDIYSADQMTLVVVSQRGLDEQEALVRERFSDVPNSSIGDLEIPPAMYLEESLPFVYGYQTIMTNRTLSIEWPVPDIKPHYRTKPLAYLGNLIGHEGEGSLHQLLQDRGWISSLGAGGGFTDNGNSSFSVTIGVTEAGWEHLDQINALVYTYIDMLRAQPIDEWRYQEQAALAELSFDFMEQSTTLGTVNSLIQASVSYEPEDLLSGIYLMTTFDAPLITKYLSHLTRDNAITSISAPDIETEHVEKWFNVPYTLSPAIDTMVEADHEFSLPAQNPFVPEDTNVIDGVNNSVPSLVFEADGLKVWQAVDTEFKVPRTFATVRLQYGEPNAEPLDTVNNALLTRLLNVKLNARTYPALIAGLSSSFSVNAEGLSISVNGYDDKQAVLLGTMLEFLSTFEIDAEQLEIQKTELAKNYDNFKDERPYQQAYSTISFTLMSSAWAPSVLREQVDQVNATALTEWLQKKLSAVSVTALVVGNSATEDATAIADTIQSRLTLVEAERRIPTVVSPDQHYTRNLAIEHDDALYLATYLGADESVAERAMLQLIGQVTSQAYFNELRTEQQLGYATFAQYNTLFRHPGIVFLVQSPVADTIGLQTATSEFIKQRRAELENMEATEIEDFKNGLITSLLEKDKNLSQRSTRYLNDLLIENVAFDTRVQIAELIAQISKEKLLAAYDRILLADETRMLEVFSPGKKGVELAAGVAITDPAAFKNLP